jgi:hypothetical protein
MEIKMLDNISRALLISAIACAAAGAFLAWLWW